MVQKQQASPDVQNASPTADHPAMKRLRGLSILLDDSIPVPGTDYRVGLDPIVGLLPGAGDTLTGLVSAYIVIEAARLGVPVPVLAQMVLNIVLESIVGTLPVLGDLFDVVWKANLKNLELIEDYMVVPDQITRRNQLVFVGLVMGLVVTILTFTIGVPLLVVSGLIQLIFG